MIQAEEDAPLTRRYHLVYIICNEHDRESFHEWQEPSDPASKGVPSYRRKGSLTRVPGGILICESDHWEGFEEGSRELGDAFFKAMDARDRETTQSRDFSAGI